MRNWLLGIIIVAMLAGISWQLKQVTLTAWEKDVADLAIPVQGGTSTAITGANDLQLLARVIAAEARGEPFEGQVAVAAVLLNRIKHPSFPNSLAEVVYQPLAFESVMTGHIWGITDLSTAERAARAALSGWDPTYGALYFWNPSKPVSRWIWTRKIIRSIGNHVFGI